LRVIIAGFGPFPGAPVNPSALLVKALSRNRRPASNGVSLIPHVFATSYAAVDRDLPKLFAKKPDIVLIFGLAGKRWQLCIETRARNALSLLFPDASKYRPAHATIARHGPSARRGNAPFAALLSAARANGFPARPSRDAGRYLCNYSYWQALGRVRGKRPLVQFIHIPPVRLASRRPSKRETPSFGSLVKAAEAILIALIAASRR
jgi:pyroglutamyl-peptidase